jgi:ATP-dependent Lon protease
MNPIIQLPVLPLRDIVVSPLMTLPLLAGRARSLKACEEAIGRDGYILLVAQRQASVENPLPGDLYGIGVIATLIRHLSIPDGKMKLLVRGERRARIVNFLDDPVRFIAFAEPLDDATSEAPPPIAPDFALEAWNADDHAKPSAGSPNRVAELQCILEDDTLTATERLSAASRLIGGG